MLPASPCCHANSASKRLCLRQRHAPVDLPEEIYNIHGQYLASTSPRTSTFASFPFLIKNFDPRHIIHALRIIPGDGGIQLIKQEKTAATEYLFESATGTALSKIVLKGAEDKSVKAQYLPA